VITFLPTIRIFGALLLDDICYVSVFHFVVIHSHVYVSKQAYDPPTGYDIPYFRPNMDETGRAQVLSPPQEVIINTYIMEYLK